MRKLFFLFCLYVTPCFAQLLSPWAAPSNQPIAHISVKGCKTVSEEAIRRVLSAQPGIVLTPQILARDVRAIFALGYFQDVFITEATPGDLTIHVLEKPTIDQIVFQGFYGVGESSARDKVTSKQYTIVDEKKLTQDVRHLEQLYLEKGYYLAKVSYSLRETQPGTVDVVFHALENTPISVRHVSLLGNSFFSDRELSVFMATRPLSWLSFFTSAGLFRDDYTAADQQNLTYFYRDNGFAEAASAAPVALLNKNKTDMDVAFYIEEGERYQIGQITIGGDLLTSEEDAKSVLSLKEHDWYRISKFNDDMRALKTYYGDAGYAFAYVYPQFRIDRKQKTYDISYQITKGEKAYIRHITLEGNLKTRENVIRRAMKISEGERYHATRLKKSESAINKLGFFGGEVVLLQEPDQAQQAVDIHITVKETSTGNLQASLGASPNALAGSSGNAVTFFGSVQYQEKNLLGRAYNLGLNLQMSPSPEQASNFNYTVNLNFTNPSFLDGPWSYSINGAYQKQVQPLTASAAVSQVFVTQKSTTGGFSVGREIIDDMRLSLSYSLSHFSTQPTSPLTAKILQSGRTEEVAQILNYDLTDNTMNPSSGFYAQMGNAFGVKLFSGNYSYGRSLLNLTYYVPLYFTESYKTNFRIAFIPRYVYRTSQQSIPYWKRLWLGDAYQMKGYTGSLIAPTYPVTISPVTGQTLPFLYGGNRSFYGVIEHFLPIIPEAGLRFVSFAEAGEVLAEDDQFSTGRISYDVGFGFRWQTPLAPFRFEWAFPVQNGQLGEGHFVFTIGYDSFGNGSF